MVAHHRRERDLAPSSLVRLHQRHAAAHAHQRAQLRGALLLPRGRHPVRQRSGEVPPQRGRRDGDGEHHDHRRIERALLAHLHRPALGPDRRLERVRVRRGERGGGGDGGLRHVRVHLGLELHDVADRGRDDGDERQQRQLLGEAPRRWQLVVLRADPAREPHGLAVGGHQVQERRSSLRERVLRDVQPRVLPLRPHRMGLHREQRREAGGGELDRDRLPHERALQQARAASVLLDHHAERLQHLPSGDEGEPQHLPQQRLRRVRAGAVPLRRVHPARAEVPDERDPGLREHAHPHAHHHGVHRHRDRVASSPRRHLAEPLHGPHFGHAHGGEHGRHDVLRVHQHARHRHGDDDGGDPHRHLRGAEAALLHPRADRGRHGPSAVLQRDRGQQHGAVRRGAAAPRGDVLPAVHGADDDRADAGKHGQLVGHVLRGGDDRGPVRGRPHHLRDGRGVHLLPVLHHPSV